MLASWCMVAHGDSILVTINRGYQGYRRVMSGGLIVQLKGAMKLAIRAAVSSWVSGRACKCREGENNRESVKREHRERKILSASTTGRGRQRHHRVGSNDRHCSGGRTRWRPSPRNWTRSHTTHHEIAWRGRTVGYIWERGGHNEIKRELRLSVTKGRTWKGWCCGDKWCWVEAVWNTGRKLSGLGERWEGRKEKKRKKIQWA